MIRCLNSIGLRNRLETLPSFMNMLYATKKPKARKYLYFKRVFILKFNYFLFHEKGMHLSIDSMFTMSSESHHS